MSREALKERAAKIAEYANTCCHRSDGYEEDVMDVVLLALLSARAAALEEAAEVCMDLANVRLKSERTASYCNQRAAQCAQAIRALKEKP